jgi:hypothetical protein
MNKNKSLNTFTLKIALVTLCTVVITFISAQASRAAQANEAASSTDSYEWSAELVALDPTSRSITLKAYFVGDEAAAEVTKRKAGEKVMLTWSGDDGYTLGITHVGLSNTAQKSKGRFSFPVEFVSYDAADATQKYLTFKTQIPAEGVAKIMILKPGDWVTATSIHGKATEAQPLVAIRPYVIEPNANSNKK